MAATCARLMKLMRTFRVRGGSLSVTGSAATAAAPSLSSGRIRVPGAGDDQLPYLRDIYDHVKKLSNLTDS